MAVNPSPFGPKPQFELSDGTPAVGNKLFFYVAGSVNTKQNTYTDSTGLVANTNPLILNALGMPTTEIWFTAGQSYKVVYAPATDTDPPTSPIFTVDHLLGINDTTSSQTEWIAGPVPTFVSATSFTLVGDQTATFTKSRRLRTTNTGGTIYSTITNSVFGAVTTVTVANDSGVLDAGLSAVSYGLISSANPTIDADMVHRKGTAVASAATTDIWSIAGDYVHVTGIITITSLGTAPYAGAERTVVFDGALTLTHNAVTLVLPGGANIITAPGDIAVFRADTTANIVAVSYTQAAVSEFTTGDVKLTIKTVADAGWVLMDDGTIGNAASGGTTRANADTVALYTLLWNNTVDGNCPVSTGRGANAAADFAANKTITLPKALGRALAGYGAGAGLTARAMGEKIGAETLPAHTHTVTAMLQANAGAGGGSAFLGNDTALTTGSTGTGTHGVMQPTVFLNVMIKL